ncbi:MAG: hypothetical protein L0G67_13510 [Acinetobacter sp.]|nr:hypothetical protein [Acinetobacter sp.]
MVILSCCLFWLWTYWLKPEPGSRSLELYSPTENVQQVEGYTITSLEPYVGEFRVLSRENYRMGREAELSPVDFALGWNEMAKPEVYKQLSITQSNRWYYWRYENNPPIPLNDIASSSANTHLIPANKVVAQKLADIDADDMVYLKGQLVEVKSADGWTWRSSLSRTDTGNGACELMLVEDVREISSL